MVGAGREIVSLEGAIGGTIRTRATRPRHSNFPALPEPSARPGAAGLDRFAGESTVASRGLLFARRLAASRTPAAAASERRGLRTMTSDPTHSVAAGASPATADDARPAALANASARSNTSPAAATCLPGRTNATPHVQHVDCGADCNSWAATTWPHGLSAMKACRPSASSPVTGHWNAGTSSPPSVGLEPPGLAGVRERRTRCLSLRMCSNPDTRAPALRYSRAASASMRWPSSSHMAVGPIRRPDSAQVVHFAQSGRSLAALAFCLTMKRRFAATTPPSLPIVGCGTEWPARQRRFGGCSVSVRRSGPWSPHQPVAPPLMAGRDTFVAEIWENQWRGRGEPWQDVAPAGSLPELWRPAWSSADGAEAMHPVAVRCPEAMCWDRRGWALDLPLEADFASNTDAQGWTYGASWATIERGAGTMVPRTAWPVAVRRRRYTRRARVRAGGGPKASPTPPELPAPTEPSDPQQSRPPASVDPVRTLRVADGAAAEVSRSGGAGTGHAPSRSARSTHGAVQPDPTGRSAARLPLARGLPRPPGRAGSASAAARAETASRPCLDRDEEIRAIASDAVEVHEMMEAVAAHVRSGSSAIEAVAANADAAASSSRDGARHLASAHDASDSCSVM